MIGYKATRNMKCREQTYEVGQTYTVDRLEICRSGFHFCQTMQDVLGYYNYSKDFILLEVEALGNVETEMDKSVTDCIKILRVIPKEEWTFFDIDKNQIHHKPSNEVEYWTEYDSNGNVIHYKNTNGVEYWREYHSNGTEIHYKGSAGFERWTEYHSNGKEIHYKDSNGVEYWREYDSNGKEIHK